MSYVRVKPEVRLQVKTDYPASHYDNDQDPAFVVVVTNQFPVPNKTTLVYREQVRFHAKDELNR